MENSDQKRLFLTMGLSLAILIGWQYFFAKKNVSNSIPSTQVTSDQRLAPKVSVVPNADQNKEPLVAANNDNTRTFETYSENGTTLSVSSDFVIKNFIVEQSGLSLSSVATDNSYISVDFLINNQIIKPNFKFFKGPTGISATDDSFGIKAEVKFEEGLGITFLSANPIRYKIRAKTVPQNLDSKFSEFVLLNGGAKRIKVGDDTSGEGSIEWFGIDYNYHIAPVIFEQKVLGKYSATPDGLFTFEAANEVKDINFRLKSLKKNYDSLLNFNRKLELSLDFGVFGLLAVPMLKSLQFFYKFASNYGIAIIILTIVLRLLTFPLTYSSYKSMKKMQDLQPELNKIKEKFKDDNDKIRLETMELFKRSGANPISGCLPMLLQIPFFIAFYKVLSCAVELVNAPFLFWIKDLSVKDPFYVFPVLMTISFFIQQKLSPSASADPVQKKIMLVMPLFFGFLMKDLPSGLTLYIFVSTIFGILQQFAVNKFVK